MPNRDRTGPLGMGPLTGRGFGPCNCGMRRGLRRINRNRIITKEEEKKILESELEDIESEKKEIQKRMKEL